MLPKKNTHKNSEHKIQKIIAKYKHKTILRKQKLQIKHIPVHNGKNPESSNNLSVLNHIKQVWQFQDSNAANFLYHTHQIFYTKLC